MDVRLLGGDIEIDERLVDAPPARIRTEIEAYAAGDRRTFSARVQPPDTFTGRVMAAMAKVPYGETRTYGTLAATLDTAPVAVGQAAGRNPVPLLVPCHRVVAADGLGGYSAPGGVALKERLLRHEGALD